MGVTRFPIGGQGSSGAVTPTALLAAQRLLQTIEQGLDDVSIVVLGDSTAAAATSWPRLICNSIAAAYPSHTVRYRDWGATAYGSTATVATGTGARIVDIYNAAVAATNTFHPIAADFDARIAAVQPTLTFVHHGHNEWAGSTFRDVTSAQMITLCESVTEACPTTDLVLIGQNPETNNSNIDRENPLYRQIAAQRGYGFISLLEPFRTDPRWALGTATGGIMTDALHPNSAGQTLCATVISAALLARDKTARWTAPAPSTFTQVQRNLLVNGDFATYPTSPGVPDGWIAGGTPTITKEVGVVEDATRGWSVRVVGSGSVAGEIYQDIDITRVRGRVITLVARLYIPTSGVATSSGQVAIEDSTGTNSTRASGWGVGGWRWASVTRRVPISATSCRVHLFGVGTAAAGSAYFDRAALVFGRFPTRAI